MIPWNLRVSIIEPGFMKTPIIEGKYQTFEEFWSTFSKDAQARWGEDFLKGPPRVKKKQFSSKISILRFIHC